MTRGSRSRRLEVDAVAVGWGFTPQLELHLALGCETSVDADGSLVVVVDSGQLTSRPGVLAAGESTGVGGASLAVVEGAIAGSTAAALTGHRDLPERTLARLRRRRASLMGFARAMHAVYPVPTGWADRLTGDTLVCRCEEVTVAQLRHAVELGAVDVRTAKLLSRAGMGRCQGRVCGYAAACLTAEWTGGTYDPRGVAERPVASPLPLGLVAEGPDEDQTS
jgi:NADPH-dependent 2,4-dienoyl-CoA reductase/sulfur reductase-like enzyme